MLIEQETETSTNPFFARSDIARRAARAYEQHRELFEDHGHQARCDLVEEILAHMVCDYRAIYQTARPSTKTKAAHTEIKVDRAVCYGELTHWERKTQAVAVLESMGLDLVHRPKTNSYSVHVPA